MRCGELTNVATTPSLSVFSGLGGLDLGARIAGLDIALATDRDQDALSLLANATGSRTLTAEIDQALTGPLITSWGAGAPRCLIGGPPCTAFSHAGFWIEAKRAGTDPAGAMLASYLHCLETFEPDAFVMENVPGLAFRTHTRSLSPLLEGAQRLGYAVSSAVLSAAAFSVAQARKRLFVVGVRGGSPVDLTGWPGWPVRTSGWAIGDLNDARAAEADELPGPRYGHLLQQVLPGGNYLQFTEERGCDAPIFKYRGRYWSFLLKLDPDRPAPTVPAQRITYNGPFHWTNRHLRIREIARLQSFPDWYGLSGDLSVARRHLGNAVPPLLAAAVIWRVRQSLGEAPARSWPAALEVAAEREATFADIVAEYPRPPRAGVGVVPASAEHPDHSHGAAVV